MSLLDGTHVHIYKFADSDLDMPYGTYVGTPRGRAFAESEFQKVKSKHEGAWMTDCDGECLTDWRKGGRGKKGTPVVEPADEEDQEVACAS